MIYLGKPSKNKKSNTWDICQTSADTPPPSKLGTPYKELRIVSYEQIRWLGNLTHFIRQPAPLFGKCTMFCLFYFEGFPNNVSFQSWFFMFANFSKCVMSLYSQLLNPQPRQANKTNVKPQTASYCKNILPWMCQKHCILDICQLYLSV